MSIDIGTVIHGVCRGFRPAAYLFIPVIKAKDRMADGGRMHSAMREKLDIFLSEEQRKNARYVRRLKRDLWYSFLVYRTPFAEYFLFHFENLSHRGRCTFVGDYEREAVCRRLTGPALWAQFENKYNTYLRFREYYGREAVLVDGSSSDDEFFRYIEAHPRCIVKPLRESCGHGVFIYDRSADPRTPEALLRELRPEPYIVEEVIRQAEPMAALHPASVNTVRCATFMTEHGPEILFTFLRIGRAGSVVDNGGAGGLIASIDRDTGVVETPGCLENGESMLFHPDSGRQILGMQIPRWEELRALGRELAGRMPEQKYISWDLALTDGGWVVVEGNCAGQFIGPQLTTQRGLRERLHPFFGI